MHTYWIDYWSYIRNHVHQNKWATCTSSAAPSEASTGLHWYLYLSWHFSIHYSPHGESICRSAAPSGSATMALHGIQNIKSRVRRNKLFMSRRAFLGRSCHLSSPADMQLCGKTRSCFLRLNTFVILLTLWTGQFIVQTPIDILLINKEIINGQCACSLINAVLHELYRL